MSTRGLVFGGAGRPLEIESLVLDEPQHGEVLVQLVASGVCHSDLHVVDGEWERPANVVLGHEGAAIVEALGPDVPNGAYTLKYSAPLKTTVSANVNLANGAALKRDQRLNAAP